MTHVPRSSLVAGLLVAACGAKGAPRPETYVAPVDLNEVSAVAAAHDGRIVLLANRLFEPGVVIVDRPARKVRYDEGARLVTNTDPLVERVTGQIEDVARGVSYRFDPPIAPRENVAYRACRDVVVRVSWSYDGRPPVIEGARRDGAPWRTELTGIGARHVGAVASSAGGEVLAILLRPDDVLAGDVGIAIVDPALGAVTRVLELDDVEGAGHVLMLSASGDRALLVVSDRTGDSTDVRDTMTGKRIARYEAIPLPRDLGGMHGGLSTNGIWLHAYWQYRSDNHPVFGLPPQERPSHGCRYMMTPPGDPVGAAVEAEDAEIADILVRGWKPATPCAIRGVVPVGTGALAVAVDGEHITIRSVEGLRPGKR